MPGPTEDKPWTFTVVRAHGLQHLRTEKSWRPVISIATDDHQCHELSLGCDGQNPNLKQCFQFPSMVTTSRIEIHVYYQETNKKKNKKRNLVASTRCTLQELAHLQAQQQNKQKIVEIKLNCVARAKREATKSKLPTILLVAKLNLPQVSLAQPTCVEELEDSTSEALGEDQDPSSSMTSDSSEDSSIEWPEVHYQGPKICTGYWSDSDQEPGGGGDPLIAHQSDDLVMISQLSDSEDANCDQNADYKAYFAASVLPTYTETISVDSQVSTVDSIVDSFSLYRGLRDARLDSEYERILAELCAEWRFVGGSLVALAGLEAGVFGLSSSSFFDVGNLARKAIAVGSVATGIGLVIDAWFLLAYGNTSSAKFQKMALDIYGKYLFFCISARIPALCMFTSALALMIFLLSVAWTAWPTAVLVISFVSGILISLQFIVYGMHCAVVVIADVVRAVRRGVLRCFAWTRPPVPHNDGQERHIPEK